MPPRLRAEPVARATAPTADRAIRKGRLTFQAAQVWEKRPARICYAQPARRHAALVALNETARRERGPSWRVEAPRCRAMRPGAPTRALRQRRSRGR